MPEKFIPEHLEKWKRPQSDFALHTDTELTENYVVFVRSRDSDLLTNCNWDTFIHDFNQHEILGCDYCDNDLGNESYQIHRFNHWAVGWIEEIHIHQDHYELLRIADFLKGEYLIHPVLDEEEFSQREQEEFFTNLKDELKSFLDHHDEEIDWDNGVYFEGYDQHLFAYPDDPESKDLAIEIAVLENLSEQGKTSGYFSENYPDEHEIENSLWELKVFNNLNVLMHQAERITEGRNHILSSWDKTPTDYWRREHTKELFDTFHYKRNPDPLIGEDFKFADAYCMSCSKEVRVILKPRVNEVSISGEAIGLTCE